MFGEQGIYTGKHEPTRAGELLRPLYIVGTKFLLEEKEL